MALVSYPHMDISMDIHVYGKPGYLVPSITNVFTFLHLLSK